MRSLVFAICFALFSTAAVACPDFSGTFSLDLSQTNPDVEGFITIRRTQDNCISTKVELINSETGRPEGEYSYRHDGLFYPGVVSGEITASKFMDRSLHQTVYYRPSGLLVDSFMFLDEKTGDIIENETVYFQGNEPVHRTQVWKKVSR